MRTVLASMFVLIASASGAATCPTESRTEAGVRLAEQRWVAALESRDTATLDCILDPAFADTSWRGQLFRKPEVMKALPHRPASTLELTQVQPVVVGTFAIVRGINTQTAPGGKTVGSVRFTDLFVYRDHAWRAIAAQETPIPGPGGPSQTAR
jgi:uncharacterized protein DUF4440